MACDYPRWLRAFVAFALLQAAAVGLSIFLTPHGSLAAKLFPLPVSPLNARVIGALYVGGATGLAIALVARRAIDTRLIVIGVGTIAGLLLIMTVVYWDQFTVDHTPYGWIASYTADPLIAAYAVFRLDLIRPALPGAHRLTAVMLAEAIGMGGLGCVLLLAPSFAVEHWPWKLTPLLARVYASFFLGFGLAGLLAAWERRSAALRSLIGGSAVLAICVVIASARHTDRFRHGTPEHVWFAVFGVAALVLGGATLVSLRAAVAADPMPHRGGRWDGSR